MKFFFHMCVFELNNLCHYFDPRCSRMSYSVSLLSLQPNQSQSVWSHPLHPAGGALAASVQEHTHPRLHPFHGHKQGEISDVVVGEVTVAPWACCVL